jgi:hypothetical protein
LEPKPVQDCAFDCRLIRQNKIQAIKSMLVFFMDFAMRIKDRKS